jgi:hypothetical protein
MDPILLIHGYSSEGKDSSAKKIYGSLPAELRKQFGKENVREINLGRWISLSDGITLDDVSYAMDRALKAEHADLLKNGFHIIIHSTGALVVRNWIRNFSPRPSPVKNLVHLAGANFGSGLAHIGRGQLSRWGRLIFQGTGRGVHVLNELEFGSWKTIDMHLHYLQPGNDMHRDYQVQEFCIIGSQTLTILRPIPIRYVKEDSADNTVRTSAGNLNFNYLTVTPKPRAFKLGVRSLNQLVKKRLNDQPLKDTCYQCDMSYLSHKRQEVPFAVTFETAHFGGDIGIVSGSKNRSSVMPLIKFALNASYGVDSYQKVAERFRKAMARTFVRAAALKWSVLEWDKQQQYEAHAQLIFRLKDQYGHAVEHFDVRLNSAGQDKDLPKLEKMIEDHHGNKKDKGTITFYLRTQKYDSKKKVWRELLNEVAGVSVEITGYEPDSGDISYVPMNIELDQTQINALLQSFRTTIIDITLVRLPSERVFNVEPG